jgi:hypothetical protein
MIRQDVERAVVQILDGDEGMGTGFLVCGSRVLTAQHVLKPEGKLLGAARAKFYDGTIADLAYERDGDASDWALATLVDPNKLPADVTPVPLKEFASVRSEVTWDSVGFARKYAKQRGRFKGVIRGGIDRYDLFCEGLGASYEEVKGLSGAPCIVDGEAIALITDVLRRNDGTIVGEQLIALPMEDIVSAKSLLEYGDGPDLPWQNVFESAFIGLQDIDLETAAEHARLTAPLSPTFRRQLARRVIGQGVGVVASVIKQLRAQLIAHVDDLIRVAKTLWVDPVAAQNFATTINNNRFGVIETDVGWSAQAHCARAYTLCHRGPLPWPSIIVDDSSAEPFVEAVIDHVYAGFGAELLGDGSLDDENKQLVRDELNERSGVERVIAFIVSPPRKDVADRIRIEFPKIIVVFMSRSHPSGGASPAPTLLDRVLPAPTAQDEADALSRNKRAFGKQEKEKGQ